MYCIYCANLEHSVSPHRGITIKQIEKKTKPLNLLSFFVQAASLDGPLGIGGVLFTPLV